MQASVEKDMKIKTSLKTHTAANVFDVINRTDNAIEVPIAYNIFDISSTLIKV